MICSSTFNVLAVEIVYTTLDKTEEKLKIVHLPENTQKNIS